MTAARPYPNLLSAEEQKDILSRAERLWAELEANNLGGFSGCNRPFWIMFEFKNVIEAFGRRDVGLSWSKDDLDAAARDASASVPMTHEERFERALNKIAALPRGGVILPDTPEFDRDMAIGEARQALREKYGNSASFPLNVDRLKETQS